MQQAGLGHVVIATGRDANKCKDLQAQMETVSSKSRVYRLNVLKFDDMDVLLKEIGNTYGRLDVLVNNAGIQYVSSIEDFPVEKWDAIIAMPDLRKPLVDLEALRVVNPEQARRLIGDGNFGGHYERPDVEVLEMWHIAVEETRALIQGPWPQ